MACRVNQPPAQRNRACLEKIKTNSSGENMSSFATYDEMKAAEMAACAGLVG